MTNRKLQFSIATLLLLTFLVAIIVIANSGGPKLEQTTQTLGANALLNTGIRGNSLAYVLVVHGSDANRASIKWSYTDGEPSTFQLQDGKTRQLNNETQLYELKNGRWTERPETVSIRELNEYLAALGETQFSMDGLLKFTSGQTNAG
jgi:hypothetical protein